MGAFAAALARVEALETLNAETIFAFVRAIDARDPYTARHSEKVAGYAVQLACALGSASTPRCRSASSNRRTMQTIASC